MDDSDFIIVAGSFGIKSAKTKKDADYEPAEMHLNASTILPPDLAKRLTGPHHQVRDDVINKQAMNNFKVSDQYGDLSVFSNHKLRKRLHEIPAIAQLNTSIKPAKGLFTEF